MNLAIAGLGLFLEDIFHDAGQGNSEREELVLQVNGAVITAVEILNDLLNYEKISSNLMTLETTFQRPVDFVTSTLSLFEVQAKSAGVELIMPSRSDECVRRLFANKRIDVDVSKMGQVLRNLASNAIKFTPPGGSIAVQLTPERATDSKRITGHTDSSSFLDYVSHLVSRDEAGGAHGSSGGDGGRGEYLRIDVTDSGAGIAPENLHRYHATTHT